MTTGERSTHVGISPAQRVGARSEISANLITICPRWSLLRPFRSPRTFRILILRRTVARGELSVAAFLWAYCRLCKRSTRNVRNTRQVTNIPTLRERNHVCYFYHILLREVLMFLLTSPDPDYVAHPWYRPCQPWQPHPAYYASYPVPVPTGVPMPTVLSLPPSSAVMQHGDYLPQVPTELPSGLPTGSVEINGTTYFSPLTTHVPPPPPLAYIAPVYQAPYGHIIPPSYPYHPPPLPTNYHTAHSPSADMWHQTPFDPFASDAPVPEELPISQSQNHYLAPVHHYTFPPARPPALGVHQPTTEADGQTPTQENEFPYRPPKNQRIGHARRISVNIK
ncbi:hypothetical protein BDN67DRAFT_311751 [Paxillus ammoniavirescens]|nr:hypothetical protein BDN67DRAFT_311751 [Paxillus ammoniavirescens]